MLLLLDLGLERLSATGYIVIEELLLVVPGSHGALGHDAVVEVVIQGRQLVLLLHPHHLVNHELADAFCHSLIGCHLSLFGARVKEDLLLLELLIDLLIQRMLLTSDKVIVLLLLLLLVQLRNLFK